MAFEITKEFAEANNLTPEQVKAVTEHSTGYYDSEIATLKQGWDTKANTDAQNILDGAALKIKETTGIERAQGEKIADYITRVDKERLSGGNAEIEKLKNEYNDKLKNFKGDEATANELAEIKEKYDLAQQKYADYDKLKESADKYSPLVDEYSKLKLDVSFNKVKPKFPDTVNSFEADSKWGTFKADTLRDNDIEIVDGEPMAISKENKHKIVKLSELVEKNETLNKLKEGRQQKGLDHKEVTLTKIEGVPFEVPVGADGATRSKLITEYLASKGISRTTPGYVDQFAELNKKMRQTA